MREEREAACEVCTAEGNSVEKTTVQILLWSTWGRIEHPAQLG